MEQVVTTGTHDLPCKPFSGPSFGFLLELISSGKADSTVISFRVEGLPQNKKSLVQGDLVGVAVNNPPPKQAGNLMPSSPRTVAFVLYLDPQSM